MASRGDNQGHVVSLINMKGGVGKTTLAVALAWELAASHRVLLADIDPQFNATQWLVPTKTYIDWVKNRSKRTIFDIFRPDSDSAGIGGFGTKLEKRAQPTLTNSVITVTHGTTSLDVLPSTLELMTLDAAPRGTENRLKHFLDKARAKYHYIIVDCPPTASLFSLSAYLASDAYLVPVKPDPLSALGLPLLERAIEDYESRSGHSARRLGLVLTLVRATDAMDKQSKAIRKKYPQHVFSAELHQTTGIAEAVEAGVPLQEFGKTKHKLRGDLQSLCAEFISKVDKQ